ncbi:hypothetical protein WOLCODRAFT_29348 [Wolfiporia cocos MD-104 SS10]|uniref:Uncharacterized protein n=1 Tax=Wolfiporia cocos (strain MD-104) TaxID=742152 RepID=A0A2H3JGS0_WOLCO|nr:hypothetical protein WOLCODRAFT_29348 [Wolfiporia cocos MD-104 SS10]
MACCGGAPTKSKSDSTSDAHMRPLAASLRARAPGQSISSLACGYTRSARRALRTDARYHHD